MWYRFYEMDEDDQVVRAASLEFFNDAEALAAAEARAGQRGVEIWQASRRVGGVEARRAEPASERRAVI